MTHGSSFFTCFYLNICLTHIMTFNLHIVVAAESLLTTWTATLWLTITISSLLISHGFTISNCKPRVSSDSNWVYAKVKTSSKGRSTPVLCVTSYTTESTEDIDLNQSIYLYWSRYLNRNIIYNTKIASQTFLGKLFFSVLCKNAWKLYGRLSYWRE